MGYTYWRKGWGGLVRTNGPEWDVAIVRAAGWYCVVESVAGGRILLVIDRATRKYYRVHQSTRRIPTEIDRDAARALWSQAERRLLVPVES